MKIIYFFIACAILLVIFISKLMAHSHDYYNQAKPKLIMEVALAKSVHMPVSISSSGVAQAMRHVDIAPDVSGRVEKIFFKSGQIVKSGDLLVELDHQLISDQLQEERYKENYQNKNFQRYLELAKKGVISKDNLDHVQSDLLQERAKIHELQSELEKRFIRAPFSGRLGMRKINVGEYFQVGDKIVNLQQNNKILIDVNISCEQAKSVKIGQSVKINNIEEIGKIVAIDPSVDSYSHSVMVRVLINNQKEKILPGSYLAVSIETSNYKNVISLPQSAISYDENGESVFVVNKDRVQEKSVTSEIQDKTAIIKTGVYPDEMVVVSGQDKLFDGEKIDHQFELKKVTHEPV